MVATLVILAYALLAQTNDELFWSVFAFSSTIFLMPYLLLFIFPQLPEASIDWHTSAPLLIGLLLTLGIGEWLVSRSLKRAPLTPVTA